MYHMLSHYEKSKGLPYGWFILKIFEYCNINTTSDDYLKMSETENKISFKSNNGKMGVFYNNHIKTIAYVDEEMTQPFALPPPQHQEGVGPKNQMILDLMIQGFDRMIFHLIAYVKSLVVCIRRWCGFLLERGCWKLSK